MPLSGMSTLLQILFPVTETNLKYVAPGLNNLWDTGTGLGVGVDITRARGGGSGAIGDPWTLKEARNAVNQTSGVFVAPGVIYVKDGTYLIGTGLVGSNNLPFQLNKGGNSTDGYIRFRAVNWNVPMLKWDTTGGNDSLVDCNASWLSFEGIRLHGNATGSNIGCSRLIYGREPGSAPFWDHIRVLGCDGRYSTSSAFVFQNWDYQMLVGNTAWMCGRNPPGGVGGSGGSNGSLFNFHRPFHDASSGSDTKFHNLIAWNIGSGCVDVSSFNSDGNGVILDSPLTEKPVGFVTPLTLCVGNIIYMNGGRGIHSLASDNMWCFNNTSWKNGLRINTSSGIAPEFGFNQGTYIGGATAVPAGIRLGNNVAVGHFSHAAYYFSNVGVTATWYTNFSYQGGGDFNIPGGVSGDPTQYRVVNPLLTGPFAVTGPATSAPPGGTGSADNNQQDLAPDPETITLAMFQPQSGSPVIGGGTLPSAISALTAVLPTGWNVYFQYDAFGRARANS